MTDELLVLLMGSIGGMVIKNTIDLAVLAVKFETHVTEMINNDKPDD
jgi:hypothetical protein